jgi:threonine synthase
MTGSMYTSLLCSQCNQSFDIHEYHSYCPTCTQPLVAGYQLERSRPEAVIDFANYTMWRYKKLLPVVDQANITSLGEGWTPLLPVQKTAALLGIRQLYLKEEGNNPTGSFKARGISMAVSKARELRKKDFCIPTAGNAGSALAAYAAAMGGTARIYMPEATPRAFRLDCEIMGAEVTTVPGSIREAGMEMQKQNRDNQWCDISTLKEPFRLEGKKTMGYEIAEQLGWSLPDVIIYPTGGGTGLIGIWKAFQEMLTMGWIDHIPTRMVAVQTTGCQPVVESFEKGLDYCYPWAEPQETIANGLRVPKAFGDKLIMKTLYESKGSAVAVTEDDMMAAMYRFGKTEGLFLSPEGAAVVAAMQSMIDKKEIHPSDRVVVINTGSPYKYLENIS